jgi:3-hydroxyisobutyrate dehydrogenase-like beta-hydroxyacid dehydrogenase
MKVGIIGLGRMGAGIASNIVRAGHDVIVWNRSREALLPLEELGAKTAGDPREALQGDILISMLANDDAFQSIGLDGPLLVGAAKSLVHVNTSTISVDFARRLAAAHAANHVAYVAAVVFGRADVAAAGKLTVAAAGARTAVDRVDPVLRIMGQHVFFVGEAPEKANIVKVAGNLMLATVIESFGEAFALVRKAGIDPATFYDVVTSGLFSAPAYKGYGRLILDQAYEPPGFTLRLGLKDIDFALAAGAELRVPLPLGSLLRDHFLEAIARGLAEKDWVAMAEVPAAHAGLDEMGRA